MFKNKCKHRSFKTTDSNTFFHAYIFKTLFHFFNDAVRIVKYKKLRLFIIQGFSEQSTVNWGFVALN